MLVLERRFGLPGRHPQIVRGSPKALSYQAVGRKITVARLMAWGMVTTVRDATMGYPQPSSAAWRRGEGSETKWGWVWTPKLKI
jgi:hypothetical protein